MTPVDEPAADERVKEIAAILALGLLRLRARQRQQQSCAVNRDVGLDFAPGQSVHVPEHHRRRGKTCEGEA